MPMKVTAGIEKRKPVVYEFAEDNRYKWASFWRENDGDREKIEKWASGLGVDQPPAFFEALFGFLFHHFGYCSKIVKRAAKDGLKAFLGQTVTNHVNDPKPQKWYLDYCMTYDQYLNHLQRAAELVDETSVIAYLNARCPRLGNILHEEYLLSKVSSDLELKREASRIRYQAHQIDGAMLFEQLKAGSKITHALYPAKDLQVVRVDTDDHNVLAEDVKTGCLHFIEDVWNIDIK